MQSLCTVFFVKSVIAKKVDNILCRQNLLQTDDAFDMTAFMVFKVDLDSVLL